MGLTKIATIAVLLILFVITIKDEYSKIKKDRPTGKFSLVLFYPYRHQEEFIDSGIQKDLSTQLANFSQGKEALAIALVDNEKGQILETIYPNEEITTANGKPVQVINGINPLEDIHKLVKSMQSFKNRVINEHADKGN
jgi:hypothetical protein